MLTTKQLRLMYRRFNKKWFRNKLPKNLQIIVKDLGRGKNAGWAVTHFESYQPVYIMFNRQHLWNHSGTRMTMLHEMVHVALPFRCDSHGPYSRFEKEMVRLAKAGAFTESW
jgi:hypothetical protein